MAMTNAERLRLFKARQKEREAQASLNMGDVFQRAFYRETNVPEMHDFSETLCQIGIVPPTFLDDRGPDDFRVVQDTEIRDESYDFGGASNSLGRAELMIAGLADAARLLAQAVSDYKRDEIMRRLQDIEMSDLSDPAKKKAALKEATRLNKMLDQLDKQVRWTFPQWKVTG